MHRPITLIEAPCNLGLRPLYAGHIPGTCRAPEALRSAGLHGAVSPAAIIEMPRPTYSAKPQAGTRLRNGPALRQFNLALAEHVNDALSGGSFPLVIGGDCSVLLGALAGARRHGPISLVHIDGHSDFRHPGNYDPESALGSVAGMDLALATGRGEPLMTDWPGIEPPLVPDWRVVQIGERESRRADFPWPDINDTDINRIDVFKALAIGSAAVIGDAFSVLNGADGAFWIHLDVDVLDQEIMPAVDCPGSPGIPPEQLTEILRSLLRDDRAAGVTLTIFDPDLDPDGRYASLITQLISDSFRNAGAALPQS